MTLSAPPIAIVECEACYGTGKVWRQAPSSYNPYYVLQTSAPCPHCDGAGLVEIEPPELECDEEIGS
jgi:DnaJ-class molecular chaperone